MIFIDANVFVAASNEQDSLHAKAVKLLEAIASSGQQPITSDYVFDEVVTVVLARTKNKENAVISGENLLDTCTMLKVSSHVLKKSWENFKSNTLKLSLTDCTNLELMELFQVREIATFDSEFKKVKGIKVIQ